MVIMTALMCLALNVYHESRGEPLLGQYAVAQVTMNRAGHDMNNVCDVVTERKQFSWTNEAFGMAQRIGKRFVLTSKGAPKDMRAWLTACRIAAVTLKGWVPDITHGAKFYHIRTVRPYWDRRMTLVARYGNHLFYRQA